MSFFFDSFWSKFHDGSAMNVIAFSEKTDYTRIINGGISTILMIVSMLYLNRLVSEEALLSKLSNLPLLSFAIGIFVVPVAYQNVTFWSSILLFILFLSQCINALNDKKLAFSVFNAAFILGILSMLSNGYSLHLFTIMSVLILGGFMNIRFLLLIFMGFLIPAYIVESILFLTVPGQLWSVASNLIPTRGVVGLTTASISIMVVAIVNIFLVIFLSTSINIREKKILRFELILISISLVMIFLAPNTLFQGLLLVPLVILNARAMSITKSNWILRLLFFSLVATAVINIAFAM